MIGFESSARNLITCETSSIDMSEGESMSCPLAAVVAAAAVAVVVVVVVVAVDLASGASAPAPTAARGGDGDDATVVAGGACRGTDMTSD